MNMRITFPIIVAALCVATSLAAVEPELLWSFDTGGKIYAAPVVADLDGDGTLEIIIAASRAQRLLCLDGAGGLKWDYRLDDGNSDGFHATPSVVDYDGDGFKEIFWLTRGGTVGCLDYQGRLIWRMFLGDEMDYTGPVAADLRGNGRIELVFGSESGTLYCLDDSGKALWRRQRHGAVRGIPAVARVGEGPDLCVFATFGGGAEACFDADGNVVWEFEEGLPAAERRSGLVVGDLNGDGRLEVVSATEDYQVIARDAATGVERWRFQGAGKIDQTCSFALADFDGDGRLDVVGGDSSGRVYRIRDGEAVWTAETGGGIVQGPAVGDVDGDSALEVLVCSRSDRLLCLDGNTGAVKWDFKTPAGPLSTPALGDVTGDGRVEILFTSKDQFVYCLTAGGPADATRLPWPMINREPQLSGSADDSAAFTPQPAPTRPEEPGALLWLDEIDALRTGSNRIRFGFLNDSYRRRRLEIVAEVLRPDASLVSQTTSDFYPPYESVEKTFAVEALLAGDYTVALRLVDLGMGEPLASREQTLRFTPFALERKEASALHDEGRELLTAIADAAVRDRAEAGLDRAVKAAHDVMEVMEEKGPLTAAAWSSVEQALRDLRHITARLRTARGVQDGAGQFGVTTDTAMAKIFMDEAWPGDSRGRAALSVQLAQNEYESAQLVVTPLWTNLKNLRVHTTALEQQQGAGIIPAEQIAVHRVGYVEIGTPEYNFTVEKLGHYPDPLLPNAPMDLPAEQNAQPFFITVRTFADTPSGVYSGAVIVEADNAAPVTVPIEAHVWGFTLPEETTLKTSFWINEAHIRAFYGYDGRVHEDVRRRYYDLHLEHRIGPIKALPLGGGDQIEDLAYVLDNGQNNFFVHLPVMTEAEEREVFKEKLLATRALIQERGWDDKALFYTRDEVAVMARRLIPQVVDVNNWVKDVLPEWPRLQTSAPEQSLVGAVDIWCPTIDHFDPALLERRMAEGDRLWFYTVWGRPGIMIEFPSTDYRIMFWQCWKYGAEGFLYWGTTHWGYNLKGEERWPNRPWITYNEQPGHNGCGYMIYPGPDGEPYASVRLALVRDGIEDYEYFNLLRQAYEARAASLSEAERAEIEALLRIDPAIVRDHQVYTEDAGALLRYRATIAAAIEGLIN